MVVVGASIQFATGDALADAAPLFKEERNFGFGAFTLNADDPLGRHRSSTGTALPAHNHPVDSGEVEVAQVLE